MNAAHFHLVVNHFPVVGSILALLLLAVALGIRHAALTRAALCLVVFVALTAILATRSGHEAEEVVEHMQGFSEERIEEHEGRAEKAAWAIWITGGVAFLGLLASRGGRPVPRWASAGTLALLAASTGMLAWTAKAGGEIIHPETRPGFVAPEGPGEDGGGHSHSHGDRAQGTEGES